jgi:hypothetical protein
MTAYEALALRCSANVPNAHNWCIEERSNHGWYCHCEHCPTAARYFNHEMQWVVGATIEEVDDLYAAYEVLER